MEFLIHFTETEQKEKLKKYFDQSVSLASRYHNQFIPIVKVIKCESNSWVQDGTIYFNPREGKEVGTLYHEVFHSAFHPSKLHNSINENWGDPFCDAFRYFAESALDTKFHWHEKLKQYCNKSFIEIMNASCDKSHDQSYGYPASLIIKKVGFDKQEGNFLALWGEIHNMANISSDFSLDEYFCYSIKEGKPF